METVSGEGKGYLDENLEVKWKMMAGRVDTLHIHFFSRLIFQCSPLILGDLGPKKGNPNQLLKRWRSVSQ